MIQTLPVEWQADPPFPALSFSILMFPHPLVENLDARMPKGNERCDFI
jgi:hypothetical protein